MNINTKLILGIGMLAGMIILLVTLSVVNLQMLTATEPDSPAAMPGIGTGFVVDFRYGWYLYLDRIDVAVLVAPLPLINLSGN